MPDSIYPALESAVLAAPASARIELMCGAYGQILSDLDVPRPGYIHVGMKVDDLFQLPVTIVSGAQNEWRVVDACRE